jgi:hypothetical protein
MEHKLKVIKLFENRCNVSAYNGLMTFQVGFRTYPDGNIYVKMPDGMNVARELIMSVKEQIITLKQNENQNAKRPIDTVCE